MSSAVLTQVLTCFLEDGIAILVYQVPFSIGFVLLIITKEDLKLLILPSVPAPLSINLCEKCNLQLHHLSVSNIS